VPAPAALVADPLHNPPDPKGTDYSAWHLLHCNPDSVAVREEAVEAASPAACLAVVLHKLDVAGIHIIGSSSVDDQSAAAADCIELWKADVESSVRTAGLEVGRSTADVLVGRQGRRRLGCRTLCAEVAVVVAEGWCCSFVDGWRRCCWSVLVGAVDRIDDSWVTACHWADSEA